VITLSHDPRLEALVGWLRAAGFTVEIADDTDALLWGKLVINAAINPLTALLGVTNGELLNRLPALAVLRAVASETAAVSTAMGIQLPFADPASAAEAVAQRTARNRSSMLQDVQRGTRTEIDAICGAIVQAGGKSGVPTPINWTLWQLVGAMNNGEGATQ
jgi:2-dehydropantoate 2-reductase